MPCHPGSYMYGVVTDGISGQPISNAAVRLYHYQTQTAPSGCFALGGADALPFELGISASGYKSVVVTAVPGSFKVAVTLEPVGNSTKSSATLSDISPEKYAELSQGCP